MAELLDSINNPSDLKKLNLSELNILAQEVRDVIVGTVSSSGGHLGSSLGAVELIIGLHYCLNAPEDVISWDVGHQAYAHKILTGRKDRFNTLRELNGLSGFPNRFESEFDFLTTGHGSTSISTALGMVAARDIVKKSYNVVAVIGDASLGGGMAFEALNHAGHLNKKLLVILNDNEMSISKSVGALSRYLNRIITAPAYNKIRKDIERLVKRVPRFGFRALRATRRLEEGLKNLLVPGMLFEEMGFRYFGPIDGHDIRTIVSTLRNIVHMDGPVFLHVITKKGKGYSYAEKIPEKFHGVGSFDVKTGKNLSAKKEKTLALPESFTSTFSEAVIEAAKRDERIVAITAAMPEGTGLDSFSKLFPNRFFDVGMAEQHAVGFAAGLARGGLKPVVAIYSTFLQRSYDQIIHDVCLQNLNVVFMLDRAGLVGEDGPTHHGVFDISYLRTFPRMVVMAPRDEEELKKMFKFALSYNEGPIAIRYPRGKSFANGKLPVHIELRQELSLGKGEVLKKGSDVTIVSVGYMSGVSLEAAKELSKEGMDCEVIDARFIKPLDEELIVKSALKTKALITIEEGIVCGGFGSFVLESIIDKVPKETIIKTIGIPGRFIEHGDREILLDRCGLSIQKIKEVVLACRK
ncbi:1-deoxy-D-xylulose-5-phosphate synthase [Candidatus Omnitrophota bacterium]